jgi:ketosteroid isomerase-like protein
MKLYVCWGTFGPDRGHPCGEAHEGLVTSGYQPDVVQTGGCYRTDPLFPGRRAVKRLTGNYKVPTLVLDNGTIIDGSQRIIEWARANEAAGLEEYAMSQENVEIVRKVYGAFNCRNWDAMFHDAHPDFEMTSQRFAPGTHQGRNRVTKLADDFVAAFDKLTWEPEKFFESDDVVVVWVTVRARPRGGADDLVIHNGHLWTLRNGAILSMKGFPEPEKALEAAGLRE